MEEREWAAWWRASGEDQLRALLMAVWDPIGVEAPLPRTTNTTATCRA
ncbi:MAG: hypothetical protein QOH21_3423 [Acidobacteriota bacterium]|nr:hypothetical protein [Acidobacteriota bacterium]